MAMKNFVLVGFVLLLMSFDLGSRLLNKLPFYKKESYFKKDVYSEKSWKQFYAVKEAQQVVNPADYDFHLLNAAFFYATNKLREEHKVKLLQFSEALRDAAAFHTHEMVAKKFFDHYNNTGVPKLRSPRQRMQVFTGNQQLGLSGENCDENFVEPYEPLTYIQVAERIVQDLYDSPPHKANMLEKGFRYFGGAVIFEQPRGKNEAVFLKATQDFTSNI